MSESEMDRDPPRDPRLASAIRDAESRDAHEMRLDALGARIAANARPVLARLDRERDRRWWQWTASWAGAAVPIGLAAAALLVVVARSAPEPATATAETAATGTTVLEAVTAARAETEVVDAFVGPASTDWLLAAAMQP